MKIDEHNMHACHRNILKVRVGDNVFKAMKMMDEGLFLRKREQERCYHSGHKADFKIIYPYKYDPDPASSYPEICYDVKTYRVISFDVGQVP